MREPSFVAVPCRKKAPKVSAEGLSGWLRTGFSERLPDDHALQLEYNRTRQGAITQEITEIIGGASAVQTSDY